MNIEEQKMEFERRKIELEETKYQDSKELDKQKFNADVSAKKWSQISTFIPIVALILSYQFNFTMEKRKQENSQNMAICDAKISYIDKQLSEFYYPIQMRLEKDNAIWLLWRKNKSSTTNRKLAVEIETHTLIPNHEEILSIIKLNFSLLRN